MHISNNFGVAWTGEERERGETTGRGGRTVQREEKKIELERSNFWGRHHGPACMALPLCHGDWGVTNGRLTRNGSHFQRAA